MIKKLCISLGKMTAIAAFASALCFTPAFAEKTKTSFTPAIWIDPDGCEHWVFDDGYEGFMTPAINPDGTANCNRRDVCLQTSSDLLFAVDSARILTSAEAGLREFFSQTDSARFVVSGHTDWDGSDEYNLNLGQRRANAVARFGRQFTKSRITTVSYGEAQPIATNETEEGRARNRRIEVSCLEENN